MSHSFPAETYRRPARQVKKNHRASMEKRLQKWYIHGAPDVEIPVGG
jgi:hypothetical protein